MIMKVKIHGRLFVFFHYEFLLTRRILGAIFVWKLSDDYKATKRIKKAFRYCFKGYTGQ